DATGSHPSGVSRSCWSLDASSGRNLAVHDASTRPIPIKSMRWTCSLRRKAVSLMRTSASRFRTRNGPMSVRGTFRSTLRLLPPALLILHQHRRRLVDAALARHRPALHRALPVGEFLVLETERAHDVLGHFDAPLEHEDLGIRSGEALAANQRTPVALDH